MTADRRLRLWAVLVDAARGGAVAVDHVCAAAVSVAGVDSAAVAVTLDATPRELVYATDRTASELEDLTLTLGEGPCVDATTGGPVLVADLTVPECRNRWPVFAPAAVLAGAGAVFALPLRVGGIRLGVLDLYRARAGDLGAEQLADALVLADTACAVLLDDATRRGVDLDDQSARAGRPATSRGAPGDRHDHGPVGSDRGGGADPVTRLRVLPGPAPPGRGR